MRMKSAKPVLLIQIVAFLAIMCIAVCPSRCAFAQHKVTELKANSERKKGRALFRSNGCYDCHSINGEGCTEGVSLSSVGLRRTREFLVEQLRDPEVHVAKNKKAFNFEANLMTKPNLSQKEVAAIVSYLQSLKKPVPKSGQPAKDYNNL